ncbi:MAG: sugar porter family MFS transporter [Victivallales bacterium]|nr:sugar porter family MFS transporter [Victivallales bacterium]
MEVNVKAKSKVFWICVFASLGGLLFGLDQGFINGSLKFIRDTFNWTTSQGESFASIILLGAVTGAFLSGFISKAIGRKNTLILASVFFTVFTLWGSVTDSEVILYITRVCLGLAVGSASFVVPLYISEIAPPKTRGGYVSLYQFTITIGIFLIYVSNTAIAHSSAASDPWRIMLGIIAIPAVIMFILILTIPKTPKWLMLKGRKDKAKEVLSNIRETEESVDLEIKEMNQTLQYDKGGKKIGAMSLLSKSFFLKILLLGVLLQLLQQLSGINCVIYYSGQIFAKAGFHSPMVSTIICGLVNMLTTLIAIFFCDKWGRKPIIYLGLALMFVTLIIIGLEFVRIESGIHLNTLGKTAVLSCCLVYLLAFGFSLGPLIWVLCAEIFPLEGRDFGLTVTTMTNWIGNFIVVRFSLSVMESYGGSTLFFIFAAFCLLGFILIGLFTPETKGISLEEIELNLKKGIRLRNLGNIKFD